MNTANGRVSVEDLGEVSTVCDVPLSLGQLLKNSSPLSVAPVKQDGWLWPSRVPVGSVTTIVGPRGAGKSYLVAELAARVSQGEPWPDDPTACQEAGHVLILTAEDDVENVVKPRLRACGADIKKVHVIDLRREDGAITDITLEKLEHVADRATGLKLIVIDPFAEVLGAKNDRRVDELRLLLNQISRFAARRKLAVVLVNASDKASSGKWWRHGVDVLPFLDASARAVWTLENDPADARRRLFLPLRCNLAACPTGLAFVVDPRSGKVSWDPEPVEDVADGLRPQRRKKTAVARACAWLRAYLEDGPRIAGEVLRDAEIAGHSRGALYGAKTLLEVHSAKQTDEANGRWVWTLPVVEVEKERDLPQDSKSITPVIPDDQPLAGKPIGGMEVREAEAPVREVGTRKIAASWEDSKIFVGRREGTTKATKDTKECGKSDGRVVGSAGLQVVVELLVGK